MVSYYGKHYKAYFKRTHTKEKEWVVFDDSTVKKLGSKWTDIVNQCRDGHQQPFILFYEIATD